MSKYIDLNTSSPVQVYRYARDVIKGRFPEGEKIIAKFARYSCWYATEVLRSRFPEGEKVISEDAQYSFWYAKNLIKGRFPEGEETISRGQECWANMYFGHIFLPNIHTVDKSNPTKAELKFLSMLL